MPYIGAAYLVQLDDPVTNVTSMTNAALKLGRDSQNLVDFSTDDVIILRAANANQIQLQDGAIVPVTNNDIDLVIISSPTSTHYKIAKYALEKSKHVLVEKPITLSLEELKKLNRLAKKNGKMLFVDYPFLFSGSINFLKEVIKKNKYGKLSGREIAFRLEKGSLGLISL